jgi:hypothetical protein
MCSRSACYSFVFCFCAVFLHAFFFVSCVCFCLQTLQSTTTYQKSSKADSLNIRRHVHTWRWPSRPKHAVKKFNSEHQHTVKLHADGNIACKTYWTIQCSRMLKYGIRDKELNRADRPRGLFWQKSTFLDMTPCSKLKVNRYFDSDGGGYFITDGQSVNQ